MSKHYDPPYLVLDFEPEDEFILIATPEQVIAQIELHPAPDCEVNDYAEGTAEFIVKACNNHEALVKAIAVILSETCGDVGDDGYEGCIRVTASVLEKARIVLEEATK